jgi:hypothetical protein
MFCHITENWRGLPLINNEVIVKLIGNTTTDAGLMIQAVLDNNRYPTGIAVSDQDLRAVHLMPAKFHGKDRQGSDDESLVRGESTGVLQAQHERLEDGGDVAGSKLAGDLGLHRFQGGQTTIGTAGDCRDAARATGFGIARAHHGNTGHHRTTFVGAGG